MVELLASRDVRAGEALTLSYGNLTNADLLLDYGFTVPDNPFDR
jgi:protein-histidine N-methyltransferase